MGKINDGLYYFFILLYNHQQDTEGYDHPSQGFEAMMSIISRFIYNMCIAFSNLLMQA